MLWFKKAQISAALALTILSLVSPGWAQTTLGGVTGSVTDDAGAVVAGAQIGITNNGTGLARKTTTGSNGSFAFRDLPVGVYTVDVTRESFDAQHYPSIQVQADRTVALNVGLKPGQISTSVTVEGSPLLNSTDTTNGYVLDSVQIEASPLGTGSFTQLAVLAPGVSADFLSDTGTNTGLGNQNIWANGQRLSSNSFTMNSVLANNLFNGASSSQVSANRAVLNTGENFLHRGGTIQTNTSIFDAIGQALPSPPQETIQELRVNTSMFDASQGTTAGAHIDVTTKSGTNQWHGSLYGTFGNAGLNAAPYFFNQDDTIPASQKVPDLHRGIYGATVGGPLVKNKLFFFGSYQGTRIRDKLNSLSTAYVPTGLTSDRSTAGLLNAANMYCSAAVSNNGGSVSNCSDAGAFTGSLDPVAAKLLQSNLGSNPLVPSFQTDTGIPGGNTQLFGPASTFDALQTNGNVDYNISNNDVLSGQILFSARPYDHAIPQPIYSAARVSSEVQSGKPSGVTGKQCCPLPQAVLGSEGGLSSNERSIPDGAALRRSGGGH